MALITHQTLGYSALAARTKPHSLGVKLSLKLVGGADKLAFLRHCSHFRSKPYVLSNHKHFKVSSFKSNGQTDEAAEVDRAPRFIRKSVRPSSFPEEREETLTDSPDSTSHLSTSEDRDCQSVRKMFKMQPITRQSQMSSVSVDEVYDERPSSGGILRNPEVSSKEETKSTLKAVFLWFMGLDATIKIPLLIFVPWYCISRVVYGMEVTKELTPLWILGPIMTALYIKLIKGLCFLYIFSFKLAIRFLENVPTWCALAYRFIVEGRLQAFLYACLCQPIVDLKNRDYRALGRQKLAQLRECAVEAYLDYVESIWPYYCRMIRFLKRANLL